jgi:hypothetical protein
MSKDGRAAARQASAADQGVIYAGAGTADRRDRAGLGDGVRRSLESHGVDGVDRQHWRLLSVSI